MASVVVRIHLPANARASQVLTNHSSIAPVRVRPPFPSGHHLHQPRHRLFVHQRVQVEPTRGSFQHRPLRLDQHMARRVSFRPQRWINRARLDTCQWRTPDLTPSLRSAAILYFLLMTWVIVGVLREKKPMSASSSSDSSEAGSQAPK